MKELTCTHCSRQIRVPQIAPGAGVKCPYCQQVFVYSEQPAAPVAVGAGAGAAAGGGIPRVSGGVPMSQPGFSGGAPRLNVGAPGQNGHAPSAIPPMPPMPQMPPMPVLPQGPTMAQRGSAIMAPVDVGGVPGSGISAPVPAPTLTDLKCPTCAKTIRVSGVQPGMSVQCPYCRGIFAFNPASAMPPAPRPPAPPPMPMPVPMPGPGMAAPPGMPGMPQMPAGMPGMPGMPPMPQGMPGMPGMPAPVPMPVPMPMPAPMGAGGVPMPMPVPMPVPGGAPGAPGAPVPVPVPVAVQIPGANGVSKPDEGSLAKAAAIMDRPSRTAKFSTMTALKKRNATNGTALVGLAVCVLVGGVIFLTIMLNKTPVVKGDPGAGKTQTQKNDGWKPPEVIDEPKKKQERAPGTAEGPAATAGFRSSPDLPPNPNDPSIDADIKVEEVVVVAPDFDPDIGGNPNAIIRGKIHYEGPEQALEKIEIRATKYTRGPGGGWKADPISPRQSIVAVPKKKSIDFRLRLNCKQNEVGAFTVVAYNPEFTAQRKSTWVTLRAPKSEDVETDLNGNDLQIKGQLVNDSPKTISMYKVQVDLIDGRGEFMGTVGKEESYDGAGESWGPGTMLKFSLSSTQRKASELIGSRAEVRAVGKVN